MTQLSILVVAAHPDDEVLMCGGTIAKHGAAGAHVHVLFLADGETARFDSPDDARAEAAISARKAAARAAAEILGAQPPRFLDLPDNRLDTMALLDIVKPIETVMAEIRPEIVYTHAAIDLNIDHEIAHRAVLTACRPTSGRGIRALYAGETPSASEWSVNRRFAPTRYVAQDDTIERKIRALQAYGDEMPAPPHPRSEAAVRTLARLRGAEAGVEHAEAFEVIREID